MALRVEIADEQMENMSVKANGLMCRREKREL